MNRIRPILILIFALLPILAMPGVDGDLVFKVTNETGFTLASLQVADVAGDDWGRDFLGDNPLLDGEFVLIPLSEIEFEVVNVRARDDEGDTYTVQGVDTGAEDVAITLADIDPD